MLMRLKENVDSLVLHAVGLALDTIRVDGTPRVAVIDTARETFTILLGSTRFAGETLQIAVSYRRLQNYRRPSSRLGYYFFRDTIGLPANLGYTFSEPSDARFWFPCYDEPWEKATAEIHLTVPTGYVAASNGRLLGTTNNGDGTFTWHWRQDQPIATYLMCMTVSRFSVATIPYVKVTGDTIPLQYYAWNAPPFVDSAWTAGFLPTVGAMIGAFETRYGAYPFDKYGMTAIVPFGYLGMEHQTLTTMNRYFATSVRVASHELAHQWWGDDVTCGTWADIWLNEGFATYSEALWREHTGGQDSLKKYMRDTLATFQFVSWQGAVYDPVGQGFNLFDQVVYTKAAWVLHTLRGVVGDSTFFRILRAYRTKYQGKSAVTAELQAVADSMVGSSMAWFFNQWIYGRGWPKYGLRYSWLADTLSLTVQQQQDPTWPTFRMPMRIRAYHGVQHTDFLVWDSLRVQSFRFPLSVPPDSVVLDPDGWILKQVVPFTSVAELNGSPYEFRLYQNYPNPFNPTTVIRFSVESANGRMGDPVKVTLKVYDILGREVRTLVNENLPEGSYEVTWDATNMPSGVYFYRMTAGTFVQTRRMVLMR
jgi:aminopeptidase N